MNKEIFFDYIVDDIFPTKNKQNIDHVIINEQDKNTWHGYFAWENNEYDYLGLCCFLLVFILVAGEERLIEGENIQSISIIHFNDMHNNDNNQIETIEHTVARDSSLK